MKRDKWESTATKEQKGKKGERYVYRPSIMFPSRHASRAAKATAKAKAKQCNANASMPFVCEVDPWLKGMN